MIEAGMTGAKKNNDDDFKQNEKNTTEEKREIRTIESLEWILFWTEQSKTLRWNYSRLNKQTDPYSNLI